MLEQETTSSIRIVAAVIRDCEGRMLLVRKQGTAAFMQPGGKREAREDDATALARELAEELGCRVRPGTLRFLANLAAPAANEPGHTVEAALYHVDIDGTVVPQAEIAEMVWLEPSQAAELELAPLTREQVLPLLLSGTEAPFREGTSPMADDPVTTRGKIALRRAREADLPALNGLVQASRAYEGEYRRMLDGYAISAGQVARDHVVLADRDGEILGFYSLTTGGAPELDLMFVADAAQGTGLGARLFRHMQAEAARLGIASVQIVSHPPAVGFYERMGATRIGLRPPSGRVNWCRPVLTLVTRPVPAG